MLELGFLSIFLIVSVALRIFLTLPESVATVERSFSVLKKLKNFHRSTMSQISRADYKLLKCQKSCSVIKILRTFAAVNARKEFLKLNLMFNHWNHCFYLFLNIKKA